MGLARTSDITVPTVIAGQVKHKNNRRITVDGHNHRQGIAVGSPSFIFAQRRRTRSPPIPGTMTERPPSPRNPEPQDSRSDHMHSPYLFRITDEFTQIKPWLTD